MAVFYDPSAVLRRVKWSRTILPRVLVSPELWICLAAHAALVVVLRLNLFQLAESGVLVPPELALPCLGLTALSSTLLMRDCQRWHSALVRSCTKVGEETRRFVQVLQASFGRFDEVLPLRFVAAKYSLAAVYVFFFSVTNGGLTARGWGELRAKGLLDEREVQFLEGQYSGDRIALLHVWAVWACQEAAENGKVRARLGSEAASSSLVQLQAALRGAAEAAQEAASCVASPVPYHQFQIHDMLLVASLLLLGGLAAPLSLTTFYLASVLYVVLLIGLFAMRHMAATLSDPLRGGHGGCRSSLPVADVVNTTADAIAQLLLAASPASFDPRPAWSEGAAALLSLGQMERRTPPAAFAGGGASPLRWRDVKVGSPGEQLPPPLLDVGCCHLGVEDLPSEPGMTLRSASTQPAKRARQDGTAEMLRRIEARLSSSKGEVTNAHTAEPSPCTVSRYNWSQDSPAMSWRLPGQDERQKSLDVIAQQFVAVTKEQMQKECNDGQVKLWSASKVPSFASADSAIADSAWTARPSQLQASGALSNISLGIVTRSGISPHDVNLCSGLSTPEQRRSFFPRLF